MATQYGIAQLLAAGYLPRLGSGILYSAGHMRGTLHQDGETNSMGLVMMGGVEFVGPRSVIPSGTNREYGYWRGNQARTFIEDFDQAWLPLEGSGVTGGVPSVSILSDTTFNQQSGLSNYGYQSCGDAELCTWMWDGAEWALSDDACPEGCSCTGQEPGYSGSVPGEGATTSCGGSAGGGDSGSTGGTGSSVGFAKWEKAGVLRDTIGEEAIQQRCLFLSERSFVSAGSGIELTDKEGSPYSVYAKILPSGDISGSVILAQHRENPAQFVLGCDFDGRFYIRSDHEVSGINTAVFARSEKSFEEYSYPAHIFGVYASGDSRLKIYVNGKKQGESQAFTRKTLRSANTNLTFGKREFAIAERGYTGWIDEAGVASTEFQPADIQEFYKNTFEITNLIFNTKVTPTGSSGLSGKSFGDTGLDALNNTYVEFVADSGGSVTRVNEDGAVGGAFDSALWGQADYAVSSVLTFDLTDIPTRFHQLTDLTVDMWVEHVTNHPSGADLSARLINKSRLDNAANLNWHPSGISVPSGTKRFISINHPLETPNYYKGGQQSFRNDFDDHQLEISLKYPKSSHPYDASFRIYSTKLSYSGFDQLAQYNTQEGLKEVNIIRGHSITNIDGQTVGYASGDRSLTLFALGATPTLGSGIMNLFVDTDTADQSLNLVLNQDPVSSMGDSAVGSIFANATIGVSGRRMNLFTAGGQFTQDIPLFIKQKDPTKISSFTVGLETIGGLISFPRDQKVLPLFLHVDSGFGSPSGDMNLVMPNIHAPLQVGKKLLYIEGLQPVNDLTLYLETVEQSTNTTRLFTKGPRFNSPTGVMNLFVKQKDFYGQAFFEAVPTILTTGNIPLFVKGLVASSGDMNLVMPKVYGSGTASLNLRIGGYE